MSFFSPENKTPSTIFLSKEKKKEKANGLSVQSRQEGRRHQVTIKNRMSNADISSPVSPGGSASVSYSSVDVEEETEKNSSRRVQNLQKTRNIDMMISDNAHKSKAGVKAQILNQMLPQRKSTSTKMSTKNQPPKLEFSASIAPIAKFDDDFDDSFSVEISYEGESEELQKLDLIAKGQGEPVLSDSEHDDDNEKLELIEQVQEDEEVEESTEVVEEIEEEDEEGNYKDILHNLSWLKKHGYDVEGFDGILEENDRNQAVSNDDLATKESAVPSGDHSPFANQSEEIKVEEQSPGVVEEIEVIEPIGVMETNEFGEQREIEKHIEVEEETEVEEEIVEVTEEEEEDGIDISLPTPPDIKKSIVEDYEAEYEERLPEEGNGQKVQRRDSIDSYVSYETVSSSSSSSLFPNSKKTLRMTQQQKRVKFKDDEDEQSDSYETDSYETDDFEYETDDEDGIQIEEEVEYPDNSVVEENPKRKGFLKRFLGFLSLRDKNKTRMEPIQNRSENRILSTIPLPSPDSSSNAFLPSTTYMNDDVSHMTETQHPELPSVASSHVSVRNIRTALIDLVPLSIRQPHEFQIDHQQNSQNNKMALASMRPLSVRHYKSFGISPKSPWIDPESIEKSLQNTRDTTFQERFPYGYGFSDESVIPTEVDLEDGKRFIHQRDNVEEGIQVEEEVEFMDADKDSDGDSSDSYDDSSDSYDDDMPSLQRHFKEENDHFWNKRTILLACFCLLFWIAVGVGIWAIFEFLIARDEPSSAFPTLSPTGDRNKLEDIILAKLSGGGEAFDDPSSAQSRALDWLKQNDGVSFFDEEKILTRYALAVFYYSTDGDSWRNNDRWLSNLDECTWYSASKTGQACTRGRYSNLVLGNNDIGGFLPPDLEVLSDSLVSFDVGGTIFGSIPSTYGRLTNLNFLRIHGNQIEGTIPSSLFSSLTNLKEMDLAGNRLSGTLSTKIDKLISLTSLNLLENDLIGSIPSTIGNLRKLVTLNLDSNRFTSIPQQIRFLSNLQLLSIRNNALTGTISGDLGLLRELRGLYLDHNNLRWTIPPQLGELTNLKNGLGLSKNQLVGEIPSELGKLTLLRKLL